MPTPAEKAERFKEYAAELEDLRGTFLNILKAAKCDRIDIETIEFVSIRHDGDVAKVFEVKRGDQVLALKVRDKLKFTAPRVIDRSGPTIRDKKLMCAMKSNFIVNALGVWQDAQYLYLYMDFAVHGDLQSVMDNMESLFDEIDAPKLIIQIVCGLEYIHACGWLYRNLNPSHCLIFENNRIKLISFGFARESAFGISGVAGTDAYCAPEMMSDEPYTESVDWWALGILLHCMLRDEYPFGITDEDRAPLVEDRIRGKELLLDDDESLSDEGKLLLKALLEKDPAKRLGSGQQGAGPVKEHPWFRRCDLYSVCFTLDRVNLDVDLPEEPEIVQIDGAEYKDVGPALEKCPFWSAY